MFVIKYRKIFFTITLLVAALSALSLFHYGLNLGIDFKGGSILEVSYAVPANGDVPNRFTPSGTAVNGDADTSNENSTINEKSTVRPSVEVVRQNLNQLNLGAYSISPSGENNFILKTSEISSEKKTEIMAALSVDGLVPTEERFNSIGPVVGKELKNKAYVAIGVVLLCIVMFITFAFRKVSEPVSSWKYGLATIVGLTYDILVPAGVFVAFANLYGGEIDMLFVTALLAILGYSVHDKIVVFDRVRENLRVNKETRNREEFEITVGRSITQTLGRSINTSLTLFVVLVSLYFIGGESTRNFSFVLMVGAVVGTYSSILLASPLLVTIQKFQKK